MESNGPNNEPNPDAVKSVLDAALLTRRVFSAESLRGLQPMRDGRKRQLKTSGAQTLFLLAVKSGLSITEIARELSITQSAASFAITRLLEAEYIEAASDEHDARIKRHAITMVGRDCVAGILDNAGPL